MWLSGANSPRDVDPRTTINCGDRCCCCLSPHKQQKCWCGVQYDQIAEDKQDGDADVSTCESDQEKLEEVGQPLSHLYFYHKFRLRYNHAYYII